jgi:hypothetical protein
MTTALGFRVGAPKMRFGAKCPNPKCEGGNLSQSRHEREDPMTPCRVCGGRGTIPDAQLEAWRQDPAFSVRSRFESNYTDFYTNEHLEYKKGEVRQGRMPTMTLAGFIDARRRDLRAPALQPSFMPAGAYDPVRDFLMECTAGCINGMQVSEHDRDEWPCQACGKRGTMLASDILRRRSPARPAASAARPVAAASMHSPPAPAATGAHQPVGDVWMKCTAGCSNGIQVDRHDHSVEWRCTECGGTGKIKRAAARPAASAARPVAAASMPSPPAAAGAWNCGTCTLQNGPRDERCAACGATPVPASEWACKQCTLINGVNSTQCGVCYEQRTASSASTASTASTASSASTSSQWSASSASAASTRTDGSNKRKTDDSECKVCFDTIETRAALIPCGHAQFCAACATKLRQCPLCQKLITSTLKIFTGFGRPRYKSRGRYMI